MGAEAIVGVVTFVLGAIATAVIGSWKWGWFSANLDKRISTLEEDTEAVKRIPTLINKIESLVETLDRHEKLIEKIYSKLEDRYQTIAHCNDLHASHGKRLDRLEDVIFGGD